MTIPANNNPTSRIPDALAFLLTARSYRVGAFAILTNSDLRSEWDTDRRVVLPAVMLIAHAIEVYLKAWLSHHGLSTSQLRQNPYGHNLVTLFDHAKQHGLVEPQRPENESFQDLIDSFAEQHGNYSFRYPSDGWNYNVPQMDIVFSVLNDLDAQISTPIHQEEERVSLEEKDNMRLPADGVNE